MDQSETFKTSNSFDFQKQTNLSAQFNNLVEKYTQFIKNSEKHEFDQSNDQLNNPNSLELDKPISNLEMLEEPSEKLSEKIIDSSPKQFDAIKMEIINQQEPKEDEMKDQNSEVKNLSNSLSTKRSLSQSDESELPIAFKRTKTEHDDNEIIENNDDKSIENEKLDEISSPIITNNEHQIIKQSNETREEDELKFDSNDKIEIENQKKSTKSFGEINLPKFLLKSLKKNMKISVPAELQEKILSNLIPNRSNDFLITSKPHLRKKTALLIVAFERVIPSIHSTQVLIAHHSTELAFQTSKIAQKLALFTRTTVLFAAHGDDFSDEITDHIVIASFKAMSHLLLKGLLNTNSVKLLIIDDLHLMIKIDNNLKNLSKIMSKLNRRNCQCIYSAPCWCNEIMRFVDSNSNSNSNLLRIDSVLSSSDYVKNLLHFKIYCESSRDRSRAFDNVLKNCQSDKILICLFGVDVAKIVKQQIRNNYENTLVGRKVFLCVHDQTLDQKWINLIKFNESDKAILICNELSGIHLDNINMIINYNLFRMEMPCDYLNRICAIDIGERPGFVVNLVDKNMEASLSRFENYFGFEFIPLDALNNLKLIDDE